MGKFSRFFKMKFQLYFEFANEGYLAGKKRQSMALILILECFYCREANPMHLQWEDPTSRDRHILLDLEYIFPSSVLEG